MANLRCIPTVAPVNSQITSIMVGDQQADGSIDATYTVISDILVHIILTNSATSPSAAQVAAGQDHTGTGALAAYSNQPWTVSGSDILPAIPSGLVSDTYYLHVINDGGNTVVSSNGFTLKTVLPALISAATNNIGSEIILIADGALYGTTVASQWTINGVSNGTAVDSVTTSGTTITLSLSDNFVGRSDTVTVDYNGSGNLIDNLSNEMADFTGQSVANTLPPTFAEQQVFVDVNDYLTAPSILGASTIKSALFFASVTPNDEQSRRCLVSLKGPSTSLYTNHITKAGSHGIRADILANNGGNLVGGDEPVGLVTRYHLAWATWVDGANLNTVGRIYDTSAGSWGTAFNANVANTSPFLDLGSAPLRLFCLNDQEAHQWNGDSFRQALWTSPTGAAIADITSDIVCNEFINGVNIADPQITRDTYTAFDRQFDFDSGPTAFNAGANNGLLGTFAVTGDFS